MTLELTALLNYIFAKNKYKREILTDLNNKRIVKFNGGLGNQMFQYAFAYALGKKLGVDVAFDFKFFEDVKVYDAATDREFELGVFNTECREATKEDLEKVIFSKRRSKFQNFLWRVFKLKSFAPDGNNFLQTNSYNFDKNLLNSMDYYYYDGYFQNENYFKSEREDLLKCFSSDLALDEKNQLVLNKILSKNSVSIHIRRGDYVTLECAKKFHGTCSLKYYEKAIENIASKVENPHFFLFSDDIDWVIKNMKIEHPFSVVDFNQGKGWLDLNLMKHCKHNVIANSSFSWWGAWLNENPQKIVIAPKKWNTLRGKCKIIPNEWITL